MIVVSEDLNFIFFTLEDLLKPIFDQIYKETDNIDENCDGNAILAVSNH